MNRESEAPLSNSLKTAVFFMIVLTLILLIGAFFFFASISVMFQPEQEAIVVVTPNPTATLQLQPSQQTPFPTLIPTNDLNATPTEEGLEETAVPALPAPTIPVQSVTQNETTFGELIIQDIGVNQGVVPIFVRNGQWDISEIGGDIGHLETTGRYPGDQLAMTFTGHVTLPWPEIRGPFADLLFLERGEEITYRWNGVDYIYQVERIFRADPNSVHLLYEEDGDKLILVTCSGWDANGREYAERLVTRAVLVRQEPSPDGEI